MDLHVCMYAYTMNIVWYAMDMHVCIYYEYSMDMLWICMYACMHAYTMNIVWICYGSACMHVCIYYEYSMVCYGFSDAIANSCIV